MDGTIGMSCQPVEISGRNYMLRHAAAELIRHDPAWHDGNYDKTPTLYMYSAAGNDLTYMHNPDLTHGFPQFTRSSAACHQATLDLADLIKAKIG